MDSRGGFTAGFGAAAAFVGYVIFLVVLYVRAYLGTEEA